MSYSLKIDTGLNCAFVKWRGNVGREDILSHRRALETHPRFRPGMNRLHDCRHAAIVMTNEDAGGAAEAFERDVDRNGDYRAVILVASEMSTGLSRLYEAAREQPGVSMFATRDLADAKAWLGLPADRSDPFDDMTSA